MAAPSGKSARRLRVSMLPPPTPPGSPAAPAAAAACRRQVGRQIVNSADHMPHGSHSYSTSLNATASTNLNTMHLLDCVHGLPCMQCTAEQQRPHHHTANTKHAPQNPDLCQQEGEGVGDQARQEDHHPVMVLVHQRSSRLRRPPHKPTHSTCHSRSCCCSSARNSACSACRCVGCFVHCLRGCCWWGCGLGRCIAAG